MSDKREVTTGVLITIGDELLFGSIANDNAFFIAQTLRSQGLKLTQMVTVGDAEPEIVHLLQDVIGRYDFVICTGGIGPTADDCTAPAVVKAFNRPLQRNALMKPSCARMRPSAAFPGRKARPKWPSFPREPQSWAVTCPWRVFSWNTRTHPAIFCQVCRGKCVTLCPRSDSRLAAPLSGSAVYLKRILRVQEMAESQMAQRLSDLQPEQIGCEIGYLPQLAENWVTLLAVAAEEAQAMTTIEAAERAVISRLSAHHVSGRDEESLEVVIGQVLRARCWKLAAAESCTGGRLSARVTSVSGSSDYFDRAFITYSNQAKMDLLGVPEGLLVAHGAVSEPVAAAMVAGALQRSAAQIALAVTGLPDPPVGVRKSRSGWSLSPALTIAARW